jgi:hypothetical protein
MLEVLSPRHFRSIYLFGVCGGGYMGQGGFIFQLTRATRNLKHLGNLILPHISRKKKELKRRKQKRGIGSKLANYFHQAISGV